MERRESRGKGFATFLCRDIRDAAPPTNAVDQRARPKNAPLRTWTRRFEVPCSSCRSAQNLDREYYPSPPAPAGRVFLLRPTFNNRTISISRFPPPAPFRGRHSVGPAPLH